MGKKISIVLLISKDFLLLSKENILDNKYIFLQYVLNYIPKVITVIVTITITTTIRYDYNDNVFGWFMDNPLRPPQGGCRGGFFVFVYR